ncbi:hypothetical protein LSAT2_032061 [Lamellibrachia satsuma]|nr:hypothetical protein LSAT2_032061 [Lamellibrachia satsuma]
MAMLSDTPMLGCRSPLRSRDRVGMSMSQYQADEVRDVSNTGQLGIVIRVSRWIQRSAEPGLMKELVTWLVSSMVVQPIS